MYGSHVRSIHLELTDKCNAACPQCPRTNPATGLAFDWIAKTEHSLLDIKAMFPPDLLQGLDKIVIGGNYGDPAVTTELFDIMDYFIANTNCKIFFQTNGGLKTPDWWRKFGEICADTKVRTIFALDGITQHDHEMYRRNTNRNKVLANAKAYIDAGGMAIAQMLVFKHNEHTVDEARRVNQDFGFAWTTTVATERFYSDGSFTYQPRRGPKITLERANTEGHKYYGWLEGERDDTNTIHCFAKHDEHIFVDALGYVTPCCFLGMYPYMIVAGAKETNLESYQDEILEARAIFEAIPLHEIKAKGDVREIIGHPVFKLIENLHNSHLPKKCQRVCGGNKFSQMWFKS